MSINYQKQPASYLQAPKNTRQKNQLSTNCIAKLVSHIIFLAIILASNQPLSNVIYDIKADMLLNEAKLLKAPVGPGWAIKANIDMGAAARGDATPAWWVPDNKYYKSSHYWNAVTPWFVMYPGEKHSATNVRVKISGIKLFILEHSTNNWRMININETEPVWAAHQSHVSPSTARTTVDKRIESDGKISYKLNSGLNPIHGGIRKFAINGSDVKAAYAQLTTELILDDPTKQDDRTNTQILVSVGADYYPDLEYRVADFATPHTWVPAIAASRFGLVKTIPRVHHMATIDPPGPINNRSVYPNKNKVISITEFEANLPPGLISDTLSLSACN